MDYKSVEYHYNSIKTDAFSAFKQGDFEKALNFIHVAAAIAWERHFGLWYDNDLDNLLIQIGRNFKDKNLAVKKTQENIKKKVTYITTNLSDTGGCSEILKLWVKLLSSDFEKQSLYITHSYTSYTPIPYGEDIFQGADISVYNLSYQDRHTSRIKELIKFLNQDSPDFIILFIDPYDVVAVPALSALQEKPKVIYFNHADHAFWLGRNSIDYLINFRKIGAKYSKEFRRIDNSHIIHLTTDIQAQKTSREEWNINKGSTISISVGSFNKVLGDNQINYFEIIQNLLLNFPNHYHLLITNPPPKEVIDRYLTQDPDIRKRFIITGPFADLSPIYGLGDFLIETIPIGGGTVQIEAMACKLPIVAFHNKRFPLFSENDFLPPEYPFIGSTKNEIINLSGELIKNPELRRATGDDLYNRYKQEFSSKNVHASLRDIITNKLEASSIIKNNSSTEFDYDMEYSQVWFGNDEMEIYKNLLLQSLFKRSPFSLKERVRFYSEALKRNEFKSKNKALSYAILSLIGWRGLALL